MKSLTSFISENIENIDDNRYLLRLMSNYDVMNGIATYIKYGFEYKADYLGDLIDMLNLNPYTFAEKFNEMSENDVLELTNFPDMPERNGKEFVDYDDLMYELADVTSSSNQFIIPILWDAKKKTVTVPAGATCGMVDIFNGGGSRMGVKILRDMKVDIKELSKNNYKACWDVYKDGYSQNSLDDIYGSDSDDFFTAVK